MERPNITPGKWIVDYQGTKGHIKAVGALGESTPTVCRYDVWSKFGVKSPYNQYEKANAKLIAAAPEMLEALIEISEGKGRYNEDRLIHASNTIEDMIQLAKDAIQKATE